MFMTYDAIVKTPIGSLGLLLEENQLVGVEFLPADFSFAEPTNQAAQLAAQQFTHYFKNPQYSFTVPFKLKGTPFQERVWTRLKNIVAGNTETYGTLAKELSSSPRAIGQACRTNPLPILIPCHRVISNNKIGGFFGQTQGSFIRTKEWLLAHERSHHSRRD